MGADIGAAALVSCILRKDVLTMADSPCDERILLRSEPFGGIVADRFSSNVRFYNHTAFFLIEQTLSGAPDDEIVDKVRARFTNAASADVHEHLRLCREDLDKFLDSDNPFPIVDDAEPSIPVLKAPLDLQLEITRRCNLACRHCYNGSGASSPQELPGAYVMRVLELLSEDRLRFISITGGEPLLHPALGAILEAADRIAESVNLSTNGTLVSDVNIDAICAHVRTVNISLDAPRASVHDHFRNQNGCFEKAITSIRRFADRGVKVVVQTTVFRGNVALLKELGRVIEDEGASSWSVRLPLASGRALRNPQEFLSRDEIRRREADLNALHAAGLKMKVYAGIPVSWSRREPYRSIDNKNPLVSCTAASVLAALLADRRLTPCILFSGTEFAEPLPDPDDLKRVWREGACFRRIREIRLHDIPICRTCGHYGVCRAMCRAKSYLFNGDIATPDPDCDFCPTSRSRR